jgi:hypothetical protein
MNGDDNASRIPKLIVELRDVIVKIYGDREDQFAELVYIKFTEEYKYDYTIDAKGKTPPDRFLNTIKSFYADADLEGLLDLAEKVSEAKPRRKDLKDLVAKIQAAMGHRGGPPVGAPPGAAAVGGGPPVGKPAPAVGSTALPPDLAATLSMFEQRLTNMVDFVRELRQSLRAKDYRQLDLPGRYHLSESDGERSAAILSLEAYPDSKYLRWLAERVTVESPHAGFLASQALIAAALTSPRAELRKLLKIVTSAKDRLDRLDKSSEAEQGVPIYNISCRKDKLSDAETLIEMRTTPLPDRMKPDDLDAFLAALLEMFDQATFEKLFVNRLQIPLNVFVRVTDPFELIVVGVIIKGRDTELGPNLIRAVLAEKPGNATFTAVHKKYALAPLVPV